VNACIRYGFQAVLMQGGIAILQPDLSHAGGITECYKIAAMADAHDVASHRIVRSAGARLPVCK
jgi:galactonate dehydratase